MTSITHLYIEFKDHYQIWLGALLRCRTLLVHYLYTIQNQHNQLFNLSTSLSSPLFHYLFSHFLSLHPYDFHSFSNLFYLTTFLYLLILSFHLPPSLSFFSFPLFFSVCSFLLSACSCLSMSLCLCLTLSVCLSLSLCLFIYLCLPFCPSHSLSLSLTLSFFLSLSLFITRCFTLIRLSILLPFSSLS